MSNLQDVPLAEPENIPPPTEQQNVTGNKSNSLKRFFKMGKKSASSQDINADACEVVVEDQEGIKDPAKPRTISRLLTRLKGANKTGDLPATEAMTEPASGSNPPVVEEGSERIAPAPNAKPTLKTSISSYWKLLFHRQKAANRQGADADAAGEQPTIEPKEMQQQQQKLVQQEQQTDPIKAEDAYTVTPATSKQELETMVPQKLTELKTASHCIPQILEEVQVLPISDEIVDPTLEEAIEN
ncbi:hypothetical protein KR215_011694 [Drosophila sulfurigaster]|nr:hypothetical protein KR215_011694 [Drosophila sulfurigaster]